jgi:hypothetical protein
VDSATGDAVGGLRTFGYSSTDIAARQARVVWQASEDTDTGENTVPVVSLLEYVGAGWLNSGDALLAATAAEKARKRRRIAREELSTVPAG